MTTAQRDEFRCEMQQLAVDYRPVQPAELGVLAIGVVVAPLCTSKLVAFRQHRYACREQQGRKKRPLLPSAQRQGQVRIVGWAFGSAVPRAVVVGAVAVVLGVGLVVLAVVGDQIGECESVVHRNEVDRRAGSASFVGAVVDVAEPHMRVAKSPNSPS